MNLFKTLAMVGLAGVGVTLYAESEFEYDQNRECKNLSVNWKSATSLKEPPLG
jgi:hypothetical protein